MSMQENNPEARAVPRDTRDNRQLRDVSPGATSMGMPVTNSGFMPSWMSRISWGSVLAGVFIALATQLVLSAIGVLVGFGAAQVTSLADLQDVSAGVGIWTAISALISMFIGGYVAARLANAHLSSDGIWHGVTLWAFTLIAGILLSALGVTGLLGFAGNALNVLQGVVPSGSTVSPGDLQTASDIAARSSGYFLLGALLGLIAAALGGWLGSDRMSRDEMAMDVGRDRMAA